MTYRIEGLASVYEIVRDLIVYRNLVPADTRLPALGDLREPLGLKGTNPPRKVEPAYGLVVAEQIRRARALDLPGAAIRRLIYIGDTRLNDGAALQHLCEAGGWCGRAFIGRDEMDRPCQVEVEGALYLANRWSAMYDFLRHLEESGFGLDEETAVVIDLDKTTVGARGRNDGVIDAARVEAIERTVAELLGPDFDAQAFRTAYDELNRPAYHTFTRDNQDYLAYICLVLGAGLFRLEALLGEIRAGTLCCFEELIERVEARRPELARTGLAAVHDDIWRCVQEGDPTPFKAFRYNEYLSTVARFGDLPGGSAWDVLSRRIVITREVWEVAALLGQRGALLFAISDKPDEASLPTEVQARAGMRPIHHLQTLVVGAV